VAGFPSHESISAEEENKAAQSDKNRPPREMFLTSKPGLIVLSGLKSKEIMTHHDMPFKLRIPKTSQSPS